MYQVLNLMFQTYIHHQYRRLMWPNLQFIEEIVYGKLHVLCSVSLNLEHIHHNIMHEKVNLLILLTLNMNCRLDKAHKILAQDY